MNTLLLSVREEEIARYCFHYFWKLLEVYLKEISGDAHQVIKLYAYKMASGVYKRAQKINF